MNPTITTSPVTTRHRQLGRKALQADRFSRALSIQKPAKSKQPWRVPSLRPKVAIILCVVLIGIGATGFEVVRYYQEQAAIAQMKVFVEKQRQLKARSIAADACRRKKAEEKADLIGKITYDELYDYGECDK